jgi:hypothetical protein
LAVFYVADQNKSEEVDWFCAWVPGGVWQLTLRWNGSRAGAFSVRMEVSMGLAEYKVISKGDGWSVLHDGAARNDYATKEAAFESAVAAASLALREGHEVQVSVPGRETGTGTALGVKDQ